MTLTNLINVKWTLLIHYILLERIFFKNPVREDSVARRQRTGKIDYSKYFSKALN